MAESAVFDWVATELEARTRLSRLEARGTLRLVLKEAGLDPNSVAGFQMVIVLERLLPKTLERRRVDDAATLCRVLAADLRTSSVAKSATRDTAYDVFERFDGRARRDDE